MSINDLVLGKKALIKSINCDEVLKNRFYSFGMTAGTTIYVTAKSLAKKTIEISINQSKIALRASEASKIEVCYASQE